MTTGSSEQSTQSAEGISFEVEHVALEQPGRLRVRGRWFGVRGRRFMRPALTLTMRSDGSQGRALADLEHKPWAAEDGEPWTAVFPIDVALEEASGLELSVAPDVAVELVAKPGAARSRGNRVAGAGGARSPRVRTDPVPARPSAADRAQELERLRDRLTTAERAGEREHARRAAAENALEDERTEALNLRSEVGRLKAELDLAATTRGELAAAAAELDASRKEAREASERLQAAIRALDQQRAESERLRLRLTASEATVRRLTEARSAAEAEAETASRRSSRGSAAASSSRERSPAEPRESSPGSRERSSSGSRERPSSGSRERSSSGSPVPVDELETAVTQASARPQPSPRNQPTSARRRADAQPARPINPALRSRPNWVGRFLALVVILGVIAAIVLVIHNTIA